jgi:hypothetical protein
MAGALLKLAYVLRGHRWLAWPLSRWLGVLILAAAVLLAFRSRPSIWPALPWALLLLLYVAFLFWADRQGYVLFKADAAAILPECNQREGRARHPDPIPVRASGWFTVEGREEYFVDIEAGIRTTVSGERIITGRVHPSRFLLLGRRPRHELGWWYLFVEPEAIREMQAGYLHHGPRARTSLRLGYSSHNNGVRHAFISSTDVPVIRRIWDALRQDLDGDVHGGWTAAQRSGSGQGES